MPDSLESRVDVCVTCVTSKPPRLPLREELRSLGVELVYNARGIGRRAVRREAKDVARLNDTQSKERKASIFNGLSRLQKNKSTASLKMKKEKESLSKKALSYDMYHRASIRSDSPGSSAASSTVSSSATDVTLSSKSSAESEEDDVALEQRADSKQVSFDESLLLQSLEKIEKDRLEATERKRLRAQQIIMAASSPENDQNCFEGRDEASMRRPTEDKRMNVDPASDDRSASENCVTTVLNLCDLGLLFHIREKDPTSPSFEHDEEIDMWQEEHHQEEKSTSPSFEHDEEIDVWREEQNFKADESSNEGQVNIVMQRSHDDIRENQTLASPIPHVVNTKADATSEEEPLGFKEEEKSNKRQVDIVMQRNHNDVRENQTLASPIPHIVNTKDDATSGEVPLENELLAIIMQVGATPDQVQAVLDDHPEMIHTKSLQNGWLPLHAACDRELPIRVISNKVHVSIQGHHENNAQQVRQNQTVAVCFNQLLKDIINYREILKIIAMGHIDAVVVVDDNGNLPVHLLVRRLLEWEHRWPRDIPLESALIKSGTREARLTSIYQVMAQCIEIVLRPVAKSATACRAQGGSGTLLPLHIATMGGVSYDTVRILLEQYQDGATIPCSSDVLLTHSTLNQRLPLELLEEARNHQDRNRAGYSGEVLVDSIETMQLVPSASSTNELSDQFIRCSDLVFCFNPDVLPHRKDVPRLRRIETMIETEARQGTDGSGEVALSLAVHSVWRWMCTFVNEIDEGDEYSDSVRRVVETLDAAALKKLVYIKEETSSSILREANPSCAKVIAARLEKLSEQEKSHSESLPPLLVDSDTKQQLEKEDVDWTQDMGRLCKAIFNVTEAKVPTSFVVLPYKLRRTDEGVTLSSPQDADLAVRFAELLVRLTDAASILHTLAKQHRDIRVGHQDQNQWHQAELELENNVLVFLGLYTANIGYLYLLDDCSGMPMISPAGSRVDQPYPIIINNAVSTVKKLLPLMKMGMILMRGDRALNVLAQVVARGSVSNCPKSWTGASQDILDYLRQPKKETETVSQESLRKDVQAFVRAQSLRTLIPNLEMNDGSEWVVEISFLKAMLDKFDPRRSFAGLKRVPRKDSCAIWTVETMASDDVLLSSQEGNGKGPSSQNLFDRQQEVSSIINTYFTIEKSTHQADSDVSSMTSVQTCLDDFPDTDQQIEDSGIPDVVHALSAVVEEDQVPVEESVPGTLSTSPSPVQNKNSKTVISGAFENTTLRSGDKKAVTDDVNPSKLEEASISALKCRVLHIEGDELPFDCSSFGDSHNECNNNVILPSALSQDDHSESIKLHPPIFAPPENPREYLKVATDAVEVIVSVPAPMDGDNEEIDEEKSKEDDEGSVTSKQKEIILQDDCSSVCHLITQEDAIRNNAVEHNKPEEIKAVETAERENTQGKEGACKELVMEEFQEDDTDLAPGQQKGSILEEDHALASHLATKDAVAPDDVVMIDEHEEMSVIEREEQEITKKEEELIQFLAEELSTSEIEMILGLDDDTGNITITDESEVTVVKKSITGNRKKVVSVEQQVFDEKNCHLELLEKVDELEEEILQKEIEIEQLKMTFQAEKIQIQREMDDEVDRLKRLLEEKEKEVREFEQALDRCLNRSSFVCSKY